MSKKFTVIDLFAGCGGLSYGFSEAGYEILLGVDNWKDALETFKLNHKYSKTLIADLSLVSPETISERFGIERDSIDLIVGGPPCQGFSISGKRLVDDPRNKLYKVFVSFVEYFKPEAFLMENVPNLLAIGGGRIKDEIISDFEKIGYKVTCKVLNASDYGVPQKRKRAIFAGLLKNKIFEFPPPSHGDGLFTKPQIDTKEAIGDLPEASVSDGTSYPLPAESVYQKQIRRRSKGIYNHEIIKHSEETKRIISMVPDGGNYKNLPENLRYTRKVNIAWTRMNSSKPSFTIDTGHNHHFHYRYNRVPTARESARIQSFPDTFIFKGNKASQLKQIGNAVPPILAKVLAERLKYYLA